MTYGNPNIGTYLSTSYSTTQVFSMLGGRGPSLGTAQKTSPYASLMLRDAKAGTGYVDVLLVGDSNVGFDASTTSRGFSGGLLDSLTDSAQHNTKEYGTSFIECGSGGSATAEFFPTGAGLGSSTTYQSDIKIVNGSTSGGSVWSKANGLTSTFDSVWKPGSSGYELRWPGTGYTKELAYLASTTAETALNAWMQLSAGGNSNQLLSTNATAFHVAVLVPSQLSAGAVKIGTWVTKSEGGDMAAQATWSSANTRSFGVPQVQTINVTLTGTFSTGNKQISGYWNALGTSRGPVAVLGTSYYRSTPGVSIHNLQNYSGGTTSQIAGSFSDNQGCGYATIKTYLQTIVDRQKAAGGLGKVIIYVTMGTNDGTSTSATAYVPNVKNIISQFKKAWQHLNYPANYLGFVLTTSHAWTSYDPSTTQNAINGSFSGDPSVCVVDVNTLAPVSVLIAGSYYAGVSATPQAHLSPAGYKYVSNLVIASILSKA